MGRPILRPVPKIACIGNYTPRRCGIATFTTDLTEALASFYPYTAPFVVALNDQAGYVYPERVRFQLEQENRHAYVEAAKELNSSMAEVVLIQHEYGIYGGGAGGYLLELLRRLEPPAVTTFHTILEHPTALQHDVLSEIAQLSARVVTMSARGHEFLQTVYGVPAEKIDFIHHGVPDVAFDSSGAKAEFGLETRQVLLTFGLLSQNKGVETIIRALPDIVQDHPNVLYLILGATHPQVLRHEGERYRDSLKGLATELGVENNVRFDNMFVSHKALLRYLQAADIYVTPYLNREQITSGTLAYAVGMGKPVVSTPYWYAEELLADGRGVLVPFEDSATLHGELSDLLSNPARRDALHHKAYAFGRSMIWSESARQYMESAQNTLLAVGFTRSTARRDYPALCLTHIETLSDDTGIFQHATYSVPNPDEGYTTDDNARALMLTTLAEARVAVDASELKRLQRLSHRYLSFLTYAYNPKARRFRNFAGYDRGWLETVGSENAHARALRALAWTQHHSRHIGLRGAAERLLKESIEITETFTSPRAWALTLLALCEGPVQQEYASLAATLAEKLSTLYKENKRANWHWFEDHLCYSNAKLAHALLTYAQMTGDREMLELALEALTWLSAAQRTSDGLFAPIGSARLWCRGEPKPLYDQQPIEAYASLGAYVTAYDITGDPTWQLEAKRALDWFFGANSVGLSLYNIATGGAYDGLHRGRVNENQGAESTLALWLAVLEYQFQDKPTTFVNARKQPTLTDVAGD